MSIAATTTAQDRRRAALSVLARATTGIPAEARAPLVERIHSDGAWSALEWLLHGARGRRPLAPAVKRIDALVGRDVKWGRAELDLIARWHTADIRLITPEDTEWPTLLGDLGALAPIALWVKGAIPDLSGGSVSIVGSRTLSAAGHSIIDRAMTGLRIPVISGMAVGADEAAHRAALRHGVPTVAVLPSGLDNPYPHSNRALADWIVSGGGALLSETPPGVGAVRHRFLDRNRIIAALGEASLIIEAGTTSGTMNEARHAQRLGRRIAAVPGTPGTDALIASGAAHPALTGTDLEALHDVGVVP